jgi:hypothetical protein
VIARVFLFSGIAVCVFAGGFWYFVAGLRCGLSGAGGCGNYPPPPWKYPDALTYSLPIFGLGLAFIIASRHYR